MTMMENIEVFRWILDIDPLWPSTLLTEGGTKATSQWANETYASRALSLLKPEEIARVTRFYRLNDAKLSLGSYLLKHHAISQACNVNWSDALISEDSNKKPCYQPRSPNGQGLEFNVSHHGTLVALVGCKGTGTKLGVDVVSMNLEKDYAKVMESGFEEWAHVFDTVFSDREIRDIANFTPSEQSSDVEMVRAKLRHFYAHWCLKEAYVKMTGEALLAPWLKDLEFRNVQVPLPKSQMPNAAESVDHWGQTCNDMEIWFRGEPVTDVSLELQAYRNEYMIGTACSRRNVRFDSFRQLKVEEDVYP